jgi:hypothetical protein
MLTNVDAVDFVSARAPIAQTFSKNCIKKPWRRGRRARASLYIGGASTVVEADQ